MAPRRFRGRRECRRRCVPVSPQFASSPPIFHTMPTAGAIPPEALAPASPVSQFNALAALTPLQYGDRMGKNSKKKGMYYTLRSKTAGTYSRLATPPHAQTSPASQRRLAGHTSMAGNKRNRIVEWAGEHGRERAGDRRPDTKGTVVQRVIMSCAVYRWNGMRNHILIDRWKLRGTKMSNKAT